MSGQVNVMITTMASAGSQVKVDKLAAAMDQVLRMPDVRERLTGMAMDVAVAGPAEMKRKVETDAANRVKLAQELDIKPLD